MWSDQKVAAFYEFCAKRGVTITDRRGYLNGDIEFFMSVPPGIDSNSLIPQFNKEYKGA